MAVAKAGQGELVMTPTFGDPYCHTSCDCAAIIPKRFVTSELYAANSSIAAGLAGFDNMSTVMFPGFKIRKLLVSVALLSKRSLNTGGGVEVGVMVTTGACVSVGHLFPDLTTTTAKGNKRWCSQIKFPALIAACMRLRALVPGGVPEKLLGSYCKVNPAEAR